MLKKLAYAAAVAATSTLTSLAIVNPTSAECFVYGCSAQVFVNVTGGGGNTCGAGEPDVFWDDTEAETGGGCDCVSEEAPEPSPDTCRWVDDSQNCRRSLHVVITPPAGTTLCSPGTTTVGNGLAAIYPQSGGETVVILRVNTTCNGTEHDEANMSAVIECGGCTGAAGGQGAFAIDIRLICAGCSWYDC